MGGGARQSVEADREDIELGRHYDYESHETCRVA